MFIEVKGGLKNMKINFKKVSAILTSGLMLGLSAGVAAAASFPAPFSDSTASGVAIVTGSNAVDDTVAVNSIDEYLKTKVKSEGASTVSGGDFVMLSRSSDNMNLGNAWTIVGASLDDDDLSTLLMDGEYSNGENEDFEYTQRITLGAPTLTHFADTDYNDKIPTIGYKITANTFLMNYTLDFTTDAESDVVSGDLDDIEATNLILLGKEYFVFDADNSTLDLTLLDAAATAEVNEGETLTLTTKSGTYEVSTAFVGSTEVKLIVNGETTNSLAEKETQKLKDGSYIGIRDISVQDYAGGTKLVEFSIGSGKLLLDNGAEVELNDEDIDGVKSYVNRGTVSGGKEKLDKIVIEWITDDEMFLTPEQELELPGFKSIKFSMNGLTTPAQEEISIEADTDDSIELSAPIEDGIATFNILYANSSGEFVGIGGASDELLVTSATSTLIFNVTRGDEWFVASWNSSTDSKSYLLEIESGDLEEENGINKTTIRNVITGDECEKKAPGDDCDFGDVTLTINNVWKSGSDKAVNITGGSGVTFNTLYTKEGLKIALPYNTAVSGSQTADGAINISNSSAGHGYDNFWLFLNEENKDESVAAGTKFNVTIDDNSDGQLQISQVNNGGTGGANGLETTDDSNIYETYIVSDLATKISHDTGSTTSDQDSVKVVYAGEESYVEVFATESVATLGASAGNMVFKDTEKSSWQDRDVILVGGSCINTATAEALEVASGTCGSAFTAASNVGASQYLIKSIASPWTSGKIALVVAGYEREDTAAAASQLVNKPETVDTATGKSYLGIVGAEGTSTISEM